MFSEFECAQFNKEFTALWRIVNLLRLSFLAPISLNAVNTSAPPTDGIDAASAHATLFSARNAASLFRFIGTLKTRSWNAFQFQQLLTGLIVGTLPEDAEKQLDSIADAFGFAVGKFLIRWTSPPDLHSTFWFKCRRGMLYMFASFKLLIF